MKKTFIGSLLTLGVMFLMTAILIGIAVGVTEKSALYDPILGLFAVLLCTSPLPMLIAIVSGIGTLINKYSGGQKRKREFADFGIGNSDYRLNEIMQRLTPEQQVYLENRLQDNRLGISSDGEIMSMDDLFDDFDQKEERL